MKLIGFSGHIESGKDSAVNYYYNTYPQISRLKVAYPLQDLVAVIGGLYCEDNSHRQLFDRREWKEYYPILTIDDEVFTVRMMMQALGDGLRKIIHPHIYNAMLNDALLEIPSYNVVTVSDIRHKDDFYWIKNNGGINAFIYNPIAEEKFKQKYGDNIPASEQHLDFLKENADAIIVNDGSWEKFYSQLDQLYQEVIFEYGVGSKD